MSLKVIELNDSGIRIGNAEGILAESPGFAIVSGDKLLLGAEAEQQARLHPTSSYNKYWHELSIEELNHGNHLRHTADIAFAHLVHLAELAEIDSDTIFAMPSSFSHQQLSILLGIAGQSPIKPVGVVDTAVLAALAAGCQKTAVYIDFQLHQVVITQMSVSGGHIHSESVVQIPGVGAQNFVNLMMQQATDSFIEQSRFNPQHNAEYEQLLYNQLPAWLEQYDESQTNLILELKTSDATHTAKLPKEGLISSLQSYYKKISQELLPLLVDTRTEVILNKKLASMPGFLSGLPNTLDTFVLENSAICAAGVQSADHIVHHSGAIHWVKSLPVATQSEDLIKTNAVTASLPTHVLQEGTATPLAAKLNGAIVILDEGVYIESESDFFLNERSVKGRQPLHLGDQFRFSKDEPLLTAIRVTDG